MARRKENQATEENRSPLNGEQLSMEFEPEGDAAPVAPQSPKEKTTRSDRPKSPETGEKKPTTSKKKSTKKETAAPLLPVTVENEPKKRNGSEKNAPQSPNLPVAEPQGQEISAPTVPIDFPEIEKRSFWSRALMLIAMAAVLVASVLIFLFRPSEYTEQTDAVNFFYRPETNTTVIAVNGTVRGEVAGALRYKTYDSTGRVCAALLDDRLYLIEGRDVTEVATTVSDCVLSSNGKVLAYRNTGKELFYMSVGKKNGTSRISGSTADPHYCLSPDGKELFYTYERDGVMRVDVYSRTGTKPYFSQNEGLYPVAIADDCRYLYYTDGSGALYVLVSKTGDRVLCGDAPDMTGLVFNRDFSELLFRKGQRLLLPGVGSTEALELMPNRRVAVRALCVGKQYLTESLCDQYYLHYKGTGLVLAYLEEKKDQGVLTTVYSVDGADSVTVTDKSVFFLSTSQGSAEHTNLYRCKTGKTQVEELYWDVSLFCTNVDGSRLLFTDVHGALFSYRIGSFPERLCDSILEEKGIRVTADDTFYFYREEGKLWVSDNGEAPRAVREGVGFLTVDGMTAYYMTDITEEGFGTVYSNYRNRRKDVLVAERIRTVN